MKRKITLNGQFVKLKIRLRSIILERKIVTLSTLTIQHHGRKQKKLSPFRSSLPQWLGSSSLNLYRKILNIYQMTRTHKSHIHFNIKDPTKFGHQHDIAHLSNCPDPNCNDKYTGELPEECMNELLTIAVETTNCIYLNLLMNKRIKMKKDNIFK